jgi:hypothetical protein
MFCYTIPIHGDNETFIFIWCSQSHANLFNRLRKILLFEDCIHFQTKQTRRITIVAKKNIITTQYKTRMDPGLVVLQNGALVMPSLCHIMLVTVFSPILSLRCFDCLTWDIFGLWWHMNWKQAMHLGHSAFLASWYKNYIESLECPRYPNDSKKTSSKQQALRTKSRIKQNHEWHLTVWQRY